MLLKGDIDFHDGEAALRFGARERGEKVKTGSNQGGLVDRAWLVDVLLELTSVLDYGQAISPFDPVHFRKVWWRTLKKLDGVVWPAASSAALSTFSRRHVA